MPGYQAVLFDLDGTLLDSSPDFYHIISRMLEEAHRPPIDPMDFRQQVSLGGRAMVSHAFGLPSDSAETEALLAEFLQRYALQPLVHGQLFAGLDRLLLWLDRQRLPWGIVTNKAERFSRPILESLGAGPALCQPDLPRTGELHQAGPRTPVAGLQAAGTGA